MVSHTVLTSIRPTDYERLLVLDPTLRDARRSLQLIKPRVEAAQKHEMGEMMDKLKGLGNSILGALLERLWQLVGELMR
jgi:hypothetical protein